MIVIYNRSNVHIIPRVGGVDQVRLVPGSQEVPTHEWFEARGYVKDMIEDGIIEEVWTKMNPDTKDIDKRFLVDDPTDKASKLYPAVLRDKNKTEATKIVEKCDDLPTLRKWNDTELRPEVSLAILNQLRKNDKGSNKDYKGMEKQVLDNYSNKR